MTKCREVMTSDISCCLPQDSVERAASLMRDHDVGPVPIVKSRANKELVGIVTDRDLVVKVIAAGRDPKATKVEDVMTRDPVTCSPDDDVRGAVKHMSEHQIRRVPIVDQNGCVLGIISQADIATRVGSDVVTGKVVEDISK